MRDLRQHFRDCARGRVCFVGLGNVDHADDGFGVRLAERLLSDLPPVRAAFDLQPPAFTPQVVIAGTSPETFVGRVAAQDWDHVIFLDAADFGSAPGTVALFDSAGLAAKFPQVSTHRLSLSLLAQYVETHRATRAWLLAVQPASMQPKCGLTPCVEKTLRLLGDLLSEIFLKPAAGTAETQNLQSFSPASTYADS